MQVRGWNPEGPQLTGRTQGIMPRKAWIFRCGRAADCAADDEDDGNAALRAEERAHEAGQGRKTLRPLDIPGESVNRTFE